MRRMGFCERWVNLIMVCVRTVTYSILVGMKKVSCNLVLSIVVRLLLIPLDCCSIPFNQSKVAYKQKISKRKKPITCPFEAQIAIHFFQYLKDIIS